MQLHLDEFLQLKGHSGHKTYEVVRTLKLLSPLATSPVMTEVTSSQLDPLRYGQVQELNISGIRLEEENAKDLAEALQADVATAMLKTLSMDSCSLTDEIAVIISGGLRMHRDLFRLKVSGNRALGDRGFAALVQNLKNLGVAFLKHCPMITGAGLDALVESCSKLEELHAEGSGISARSLLRTSELKLLDKLTISEDLPIDTDILLDLLCGCSSLDWDSLANLMGRVCMLMREDGARVGIDDGEASAAAAIMSQDVAAGEEGASSAAVISEDLESRMQDMAARKGNESIDIKKLLKGQPCQGFQISEGGDGRYGQFKTYVRITFRVTEFNPKTGAVKVTIRNAVGTRLARGFCKGTEKEIDR